MHNIKFSQNWNNKLDGVYFTTVRLYTKEKAEYYYELFSNKENVAILLNEKVSCIAKIVDMNVVLLKDIPPSVMMIDVGDDEVYFYDLMKSMYEKNPEWDGKFTRMIVLTLKKEHGI